VSQLVGPPREAFDTSPAAGDDPRETERSQDSSERKFPNGTAVSKVVAMTAAERATRAAFNAAMSTRSFGPGQGGGGGGSSARSRGQRSNSRHDGDTDAGHQDGGAASQK
jgi:hypothetical protein